MSNDKVTVSSVVTDQISMRLEVLKGEWLGALRANFMVKVQLEEKRESNEIDLHYNRGLLQGLQMACDAIAEIRKGEELEAARQVREKMLRHLLPDTPGSDHPDKVGLPNV